MFMNFPATARYFFYRKSWRNCKKFMELSRLSYFLHNIEHLEYSRLELELRAGPGELYLCNV